ncbi:MAG: VOC family protein, partial [Pseudomonadota bacterium]
MDIKKLWLNLPVKDPIISRAFYEKVGFKLNQDYGNGPDSASFFVGESKIVLMLFNESSFAGFVNGKVADLSNGNEVLFSLSADSKAEVDEMVQVVKQAGGTLFAEPRDSQGWMYG